MTTSETQDWLRELSDAQVVGLTVWGEARGCDVRERVAVAAVIRNRVTARRYGSGWKGVCLRGLQFSCWDVRGGAANAMAVWREANRLLAYEQVPDPTWPECLWVSTGVIEGRLLDPTHGATHYHTVGLTPPAWARSARVTLETRWHRYYADVD